MKLIPPVLLAALSLLVAACASTSDSNKSLTLNSFNSEISANSSLTLAQQIDQFLESKQDSNRPGIAILVVKDGKIVYSGGKGMATRFPATSISAQTGFRLASVSKLFTAVAIMQLVEQGQLHLNDSLLTYIPELPASWQSITIDQLLCHKSGIYDVINDGWQPNLLNGLTNDKLITYLSKHRALEFPPGSQADYSNTGYMLLAKVIERKTGNKFSTYMRQKIFKPAGMKNSYINDEYQSIKTGDALNYASLMTYYGITTYTKGSMAQVSSIEDFSNFFTAMRNNKLISAETFATMISPHSILRSSKLRYGYGFLLKDGVFGHDGDWDGFQTLVTVDPAKKLEWVILTNSGATGLKNIEKLKIIISEYYGSTVIY